MPSLIMVDEQGFFIYEFSLSATITMNKRVVKMACQKNTLIKYFVGPWTDKNSAG